MKHHSSHLLLFTGFGFLFLWFDIFLGHAGAKLHHFWMWPPLIFLPCACAVSMLYAFRATRLVQIIFRLVCLTAIITGILGFSFHSLKLMREIEGIIQWEVLLRLLRYPPVLAPFAVSGLGILGLLINGNGRQEMLKK